MSSYPRYLLAALVAVLPLSLAAQTCQTATITASTPDSQLTDNGDGTVTDSATGLMWKQCAEGLSGAGCASGSAEAMNWQAALQRPATLNVSGGFAGYTDWRLPNLKELHSIVEEQCYSPSINITYFPNAPASYFWSGSPYAYNSASAWYVRFGSGYANYNDRNNGYRVRLVRVGQ